MTIPRRDMGRKAAQNCSSFSNFHVSKISGESLICGNVLFWDDGKKIILTSGSTCKIFSVNSGEHIRDLFTLKSAIVSCHRHPTEVNSVIAFSEEGEFVTHNVNDNKTKTSGVTFNASLLNNKNVPRFNTDKLFYHSEDHEKNYEWKDEMLNNKVNRRFFYGVPQLIHTYKKVVMWTSWSLHDEHHCHITVFSFPSGAQMQKVKVPNVAFKKCYKNFAVGYTHEKNFVFVGMGTNFVFVCMYTQGGLFKYSSYSHLLGDAVEVNCLAFHPTDCSFSTADTKGIITVWRNINSKKPLKETFKWHTDVIRDLAFTSTGCYLFSGGNENVLVKWSMLNQKKDFLPRLSAAICFISLSEDSSLIAVSLANNEILIMNSISHKISTIQSVSSYYIQERNACYDILVSDPRTDYLVLNGTPGHLQFLSTEKYCKLRYSLDVGKVNYMTGSKLLQNLHITHAKFNRNGQWLVTAESRRDPFVFECRLKFWYFNEQKQSFVLNTNMELPHDESEVNMLEISNDDLVATSGTDKQFKLWAPFETNSAAGTKTVWSLLSVGKYRLLPCYALDFSKDATLIAVSFGPSLTLWCTSTCGLKCSLTPPFKRENLKFIKFGSDEFSHLIVTATEYSLTAWNIITLTIMWNVELQVSLLTSDFFGTYMCAVSRAGTLFVFRPSSSSPDLVVENVSKSEVVAAHALARVEKEKTSFELYMLNSKLELLRFREDGEEDGGDAVRNESEAALPTRFAHQLPHRSKGGAVRGPRKLASNATKVNPHYMASILDAPAYTLPNPSRFCSDLLMSLAISVKEPVKSKRDSKDKTFNSKIDDDTDIVEIVTAKRSDPQTSGPTEDKLWETVNDLFKKY